ncbi:N-6 DNA methylase [Streptomyces sp. Lzd4kr]|nr:N-6 DNA methylase [Streptomyces sp. Lzd4kr]
MQLDLFAAEEPPEPDPSQPRIRLRPADAPPPAAEHTASAPATPPAARRRRNRTRGLSPTYLALDVAETVARVWHRARVDSRLEVPVGVVAVLSLLRQADDGPDVADHLMTFSPEELLDFYRRVWGLLWISRPELVAWAYPLRGWVEEEEQSPKRLAAVHAVTHAALNTGLMELTGHPDPALRSDADVLGFLVTELRSRGAREALGQVHTPPEMCDLMVRMTLSPEDIPEGAWLSEPTAGTGGIFRAAAQYLRESGRNPRAYVWAMNDLDPISAACCAVNAVVWDLGRSVLVSCTDTLHEGDGTERAIAERAAIIARRNELVGQAETIAATMQAISEVDALISRGPGQAKAS